MNRAEFFGKIIESLQTDNESISESTMLIDVDEWDSLAVITTIAAFKNLLKITVEPSLINDCDTFCDLLNLAEGAYA